MIVASAPENRLAQETSPYLLQHKNNPVAWWPWGPDALAHAKQTNKPILLSVGYAACHWCHVMAHESFENDAIAAVMNKLFVNIKVDREERPDIDQIYMNALHALGEQGGWPLTMFLTSDGEPVWGGTYFPNAPRYGRPGFADVLTEVARLFRDEPQKIAQNRTALMSRLAEKARPAGEVVIGRRELDTLATQTASSIDHVNGGMRGAPKFPQASLFELLWRAGQRTGDARFFADFELTLEHICEGGIYDHLGGGFSRYSVDARWLVPHFEKMLYDNAQLLDLLALAYGRSGRALYRQRAQETVGWLTREMTTAEGAFCASLDADSEGEEGKFYVWSAAEIAQALGDDAALFASEYDVSPRGNFEGHNILNRLKDLPRSMENEPKLAMLRSMLQQIRENRVRPGLDDKVLADWNGMMIAALVHSGIAFGVPEWRVLAVQAFDFIANSITRGDRFGHSWRASKLLFPGIAADFAAMIRAALSLHEATGEARYLAQALAWQRALDRHYANPNTGGYYMTADDAEGLVIRPAGTMDDATPNANAVAAQNLIRLAALSGDDRWLTQADRLIAGALAGAAEQLLGHTALLNAVDMRLGLAEIVVTGEGANALLAAALALPHTDRVVIRAPHANALPHSHAAQEKIAAGSGPRAFVCVGQTCSLPVTDPQEIPRVVNEMRTPAA